MATDFRVTDLVANRMLNAMFTDASLNTAHANSGLICIYGDAGSPDIPALEPSQGASHGTLLAQLTMNSTAFGNAAAGSGLNYNEIAANAITSDSSADATANAFYFVLYKDDSPDVALCQGSVGTSDADMIIDNISISSGATVSCSSFKIRLPKGWTTP